MFPRSCFQAKSTPLSDSMSILCPRFVRPIKPRLNILLRLISIMASDLRRLARLCLVASSRHLVPRPRSR